MDFKKYVDYAINIRSSLHKVPEVGFNLPKTTKIITDELDKLGFPYQKNLGISSIVCCVDGINNNFSIGIRADMDALNIKEENEVSYKSTIENYMHACGHDAHVAILLATLKMIKEENIKLPYKLKAIFQACEEGPGSGASLLCSDKITDDIKYYLALHVNPLIPTNILQTRSGEFNASCSDFEIEIYGKSGHAAYPHTAIDPIQIANEVYMLIQNMKTRSLNQSEKTVISITKMSGGTSSNNVIPDSIFMHGTVRTYNDLLKEEIGKKMDDILSSVTKLHNANYKFNYNPCCIALINDPYLTGKVSDVIEKHIGKNYLEIAKEYTMGVDDFAYFAKKSKGVMINLGVRNEEKGIIYPLHNSRFDIDFDAFYNGIKFYIYFLTYFKEDLC